MHWSEDKPSAIVMEIRAFATDPLTSSLFECEAAATIENDPDYGMMLSTGISKVDLKRDKATFTLTKPGAELFQMDGAWGPHGGSLPDFQGAFNPDVAFLTGDDGEKVAHVIATGRLDANPSHGKVSFLGGHEYDVKTHYLNNDEINGVRVFLNSYFTADCANLSLAPRLELDGTPTADDLEVNLTFKVKIAGRDGPDARP